MKHLELKTTEMQLSLLFALAPLTVIFFDRVSLVALPVNLVAIPWTAALIVIPMMGGLLVSVLSPSAGGLLLDFDALASKGGPWVYSGINVPAA